MKIKLGKAYMSLASIRPSVDLPDFAVLMGRNGVGKTQLLDAIMEGSATMEGISKADVEKYDMTTLAPRQVGRAGWDTSHFAAATADAYVTETGTANSPVATAARIFERTRAATASEEGQDGVNRFEARLQRKIARGQDYSVFRSESGTGNFAKYTQQIVEEVIDPLVSKDNKKRAPRKPGIHGHAGILVTLAAKLAEKLPHELTREDILRAWHYDGDVIEVKLNEIFVGYLVDQFLWTHRRIEEASEGTGYGSLMAEYEARNPAPWEVLRRAFREIRQDTGEDSLFDFEFSDPGGTRLGMANYENFTFQAELTNQETGDTYQMSTLSSGERVLMALCLMSFNQYLGRRRPKLILLDEVDAVLHPSMVRALCAVLKRLYVEQGTRVMMTTHSPVTVAGLGEDEIFRMTRNGRDVRVEPTTKSEAVGELSEGLCTVDLGLRIAAFDGARVTVLTEGKNALHLKRWATLHYDEEVRVFDELPGSTSASELCTYGRLLAKMVTNTHFILVWDCDAEKYYKRLMAELTGNEAVTLHLLGRRENSIAANGIENKYDEDLLGRFANTTKGPDGKVIGRNVGGVQKKRFAEYVYHEGSKADFTHFGDLESTVAGVLAKLGST